MRHRSVASIVCSSALILSLLGCQGANMSQSSTDGRMDAGSIAPITPPTIAPQRLTVADTPQSAVGQAISPELVKQAYAEYLGAVESLKGVPWVHIVDAVTGDVIFESNADKPHTPASITKVLTAIAAHYHLDEQVTLATGTSLVGSKLFIWGEGDLLLGIDENVEEINGRASLTTLAKDTAVDLKKRGISAVTVYWAPSPFSGPSRLPAWESQEVKEYEGAVGAYAIDSGLSVDNKQFVASPERQVADAFISLLKEQGVSVEYGRQEAAPQEAEEIARVHSATIGEQIRYMLAQSDNTVADQLCRLAARESNHEPSYSGATQTVQEVAAQLGVSIEGITMDDCSGLSSSNAILPSVFTQLLRTSMTSQRVDLRDLVRDLPWAGAQGTMSRRFYDGTAIGNVQAKTGSLGKVSSLAGIVRTAQGRELVYAIGIDRTDEGAAYSARPHIDAFIQRLSSLPE